MPSIANFSILRNGYFVSPAKRGCLKGSSVTITLRRASGVTWDRVTAVARASGKRTTRTIVGPPATAELHMGVSLRGLPRGLFTLTLTARTSTGVSVVAKRSSRSCAVKKVAAKHKRSPRR